MLIRISLGGLCLRDMRSIRCLLNSYNLHGNRDRWLVPNQGPAAKVFIHVRIRTCTWEATQLLLLLRTYCMAHIPGQRGQ